MSKPVTIQEYIDAAPEAGRKHLTGLYKILKKIAPKAKEAIKWGSPVFEENRIMFSFTAFKKHLNFMPTRSTLVHFTKELEEYKTGKDTIQFNYDEPLPIELIITIASHRAHDVRENDARWMH